MFSLDFIEYNHVTQPLSSCYPTFTLKYIGHCVFQQIKDKIFDMLARYQFVTIFSNGFTITSHPCVTTYLFDTDLNYY